MKVDMISTLTGRLYYRLKRRSIESRVKARRNAGLIGEREFSNSDPRRPDFGLPGGWCDVPVLAAAGFPRNLSQHSGVGARGMAELHDHDAPLDEAAGRLASVKPTGLMPPGGRR